MATMAPPSSSESGDSPTNLTVATRSIGRADSTNTVRASAVNLYNVHRSLRGLCPIEKATIDEFAGDNLRHSLLCLVIWLAETPIPKNRNKKLQPTGDGPVEILMPATIKTYFSHMKCQLREQFSQHPEWATLPPTQDPVWMKELTNSLMNRAEKFYLKNKGNSDVTYGNSDCLSIFKNNHEEISPDRMPPTFWQPHPLDDSPPLVMPKSYTDCVDLHSMCMAAVNGATMGNLNLMHRLIMVLIFHAVSRTGELRFINFVEWIIYFAFQAIDISWTQMKQTDRTAMPMVQDKTWTTDFLHALACFFGPGRGLFRDEDTMKRGKGNFLFPTLTNKGDSALNKFINDAIQSYLPNDLPEDLVSRFTARSLRRGAITSMCLHPGCGIFEVTGRSGHTSNTSIDHYNDKHRVERGIPGARALAGQIDLGRTSYFPRLEVLDFNNASMVMQLLDALFVVSVPLFKRGGVLFPILRYCTASLLCWYNKMQKDLPEHYKDGKPIKKVNVVIAYMNQAARKVRLEDCNHPDLCPEQVLELWSDIIYVDFVERNTEPSASQSVGDRLSELSTITKNMKQEMAFFQRHLTMLQKSQHQAFQYREKMLLDRNAELQNQINKLHSSTARKLAVIRTPPSPVVQVESQTASSKRSLTNSLSSTDSTSSKSWCGPSVHEEVVMEQIAKKAKPSPPSEESKKKPAAKKSSCPIGYNKVPKKTDSSGVNIPLAKVLAHMHEDRYFVGIDKFWSVSKAPQGYNYGYHIKACLQLVDFVIKEEEKKLLTAPPEAVDEAALLSVCADVQHRCVDMMWIFEQKDPELERKLLNNGPAGGKIKGTYIGLGNRLRGYKKLIFEGLQKNGKTNPNDKPHMVELVMPDKILQDVPKNQKLITDMLQPKKKN